MISIRTALAAPGLLALSTLPIAARQDPVTLVQVAAGGFHSCAIDTEGTAYCWGDNRYGQAGGAPSSDAVGVHAIDGPRFVTLAAGGQHTCGLDEQGLAWCWGNNEFGQLGNGAQTRRSQPARVAGGLRFISITAGDNHTCGLTPDGRAWCWGDQWDRAAGAFRAGDNLKEPFAVGGGLTFVRIDAGGHHTCAVTRDQQAWCWGNNGRRQASPETDWNTIDYPAQVAGLPPVREIRGGADYSCALALSGEIYCWGKGDETVDPSPRMLRPATTPTRFTDLGAGEHHICGLSDEGQVFCWSDSTGAQPGDPRHAWTDEPAIVRMANAGRTVTTGVEHTCAIDGEDIVYCWGENGHGQLGRPGAGSRVPVRIDTVREKPGSTGTVQGSIRDPTATRTSPDRSTL